MSIDAQVTDEPQMLPKATIALGTDLPLQQYPYFFGRELGQIPKS
jgi:hypothetical protein